MILLAFTDGASRGNPGESGIGVIVKDQAGSVVLKLSGYIGRTTNNIAEYTAFLTLLKRMKGVSCTRLIVHSDSELMVRQFNGEYKVRDEELKKRFRNAMKLAGGMPFPVELKHIPREQNTEADRLANMGIESKKRLSPAKLG